MFTLIYSSSPYIENIGLNLDLISQLEHVLVDDTRVGAATLKEGMTKRRSGTMFNEGAERCNRGWKAPVEDPCFTAGYKV